jgi:hypothetical protein
LFCLFNVFPMACLFYHTMFYFGFCCFFYFFSNYSWILGWKSISCYIIFSTVSLWAFLLLCFVFWWAWGLNPGLHATKQTLYCLSHTSSPFCSSYFRDRISQTFCLIWPWTTVLISANLLLFLLSSALSSFAQLIRTLILFF